MILKKQQGGLVYRPFIPNWTPKPVEESPLTYRVPFIEDNDKFPVEPVRVYSPQTSTTEIVQEEPRKEVIQSESPKVEQPKSFSNSSTKEKQKFTSNYLQENLDLTPEQAAALVGIWQAESGFNLNAENKEEKAGKNSSVKSSQYGIGIGQWTGSRHEDFVRYINNHGGSYDLQSQLDFAIEEIKTKYPEFLANLRSANNVKDATAYAYVQYVGANERNIKDITDLYARVNKIVNRYRKKHLELYGKASNTFEQRLKYAIDSLN
jgi:hypothetical protein